ncbi:MAG: redox-regulated ATPase YchF [Chloroflexi bacterium]|nr:redox-regulated ATPase YchF [Chloroflexota bacterium]
MALEIGIVGLPNVGKSTLFNALTRAGAAVASYPFTTIEPNVGVVPVADPRLEALARIVQPEKVVPTHVRFVDIAGLVRGASRGEGLGNQFLGHIRDVDAVAMVLRCFESEDVMHVSERLDPIDDIATLDTELILADLALVERRIEKLRTGSKANPKAFAEEIAWLEGLRARLDAGALARGYAADERERGWASELALISDKPRLYLANVGEDAGPGGGPLAEAVRARAAAEGLPCVSLSADLELQLQSLEPEDARAYLAELDLPGGGLDRLVQAGYALLDLVTFFTTTGGHTVQAWTVPAGTPAPRAAGSIHGDMERGFIRAEVVAFEALVADGNLAQAREHGHLRLEGRDYRVQDGDVIHFRFAV